MTFADKLKQLRKEAGMSQEVLALKLGVSRQAVTKWETKAGIPDIDNMILISNLFGVSVDEFLSQEKETALRNGYLYESRTEYDIDGQKRFDLKLGFARSLSILGTQGEKIIVRLASDELSSLESDLKVRIDDIRGHIDVEVNRKNDMSQIKAKENLFMEVYLPLPYLSDVEISAVCGELLIRDIRCEDLEFKGKTGDVKIESVTGECEFDCNVDMNISVKDFSGALEINQVSSTARVYIPEDFSFRSIVKGLSTGVFYEKDGRACEDFSDPQADNIIELNGFRSELVICSTKE